MNKLKTILACMIITLGILYLPEIHANASTVTIDAVSYTHLTLPTKLEV